MRPLRLAVSLPKDRFYVDFYYANNSADHRKQYVENNGINTIKFECGKVVEKKGFGRAYDCNFKAVFTNDYI